MWHVSPASDGQVAYGLTTGYGKLTTYEPSALSDHEQAISGLLADTTYFYEIRSGTGRAQGMFRTLAVVQPPQPPSGDLPPPPLGQDAAALINSTRRTRPVRLQSGATYVCKTPLADGPGYYPLDGNGATVLITYIGDGVKVDGGAAHIGGLTIQGPYVGGPGTWTDNNHGVNVMGGAGHEFTDVTIRGFAGDAYYLQGNWATGVAVAGDGIRITGGSVKHVGRMGFGVVHFNGLYVADWTVEDCYTPLDFEADPSDQYQTNAMRALIERVKVRGPMNGSNGTGSKWLNIGSPGRTHDDGTPFKFYPRYEDIEVRYCDIDVTSPTTPHNAMGTDNGGQYRSKNLRVHHNVVHQTFYRGGLFEHVDGLTVTDNVTPVRSTPWALLNDCKDPVDVARNT
jgi:hypothetical protein